MKKAMAILLSMLLMLSFAACEKEDSSSGKKKSTVSKVETEETTDVGNGSTVSAADKKKAEKDEITPITLGETITTKNCEFTLNKVDFSYDVKPDSPPSYYRHYPASAGQVYIYVNATVKNTGKQDLGCDEIYSVEADYNEGYKYSGFNMITDSDGDFSYANINSVTPLQTMGVHCLIDCPEEVETSEAPVVLTITFKSGEKYIYNMR